MAEPDQGFQVAHAKGTQSHPAQRVEIAQAAGAILQVRLQVVGGIAETLVAVAQLFQLGQEKRVPATARGRRWPRAARGAASSARIGRASISAVSTVWSVAACGTAMQNAPHG
jgi:hypothetical protein